VLNKKGGIRVFLVIIGIAILLLSVFAIYDPFKLKLDEKINISNIKTNFNDIFKSLNLTSEKEKVTITKIIDGDTYTIEMENGTQYNLRMLCMDFPDISGNKPDGTPRIDFWLDLDLSEDRIKRCYDEGKVYVKTLILDKQVLLTRESSLKDKYGRELAYVSVDGQDVGSLLIKNGYAVEAYEPCQKSSEYKQLENYAKQNHQGCLWSQ